MKRLQACQDSKILLDIATDILQLDLHFQVEINELESELPTPAPLRSHNETNTLKVV